ncbi:MAG: HGGxSTG domain-containing protein, partial [Alphaproteobacteria bacterium]|nr:HGGxSTG domain-containing protein [Alphaproteobacteria bacterium]
PGQRCLAKTRRGTPCKNPAIRGPNRCRLHGGLSVGPKTPAGKARASAAHWRHGRRSKARIEKARQIKDRLRRVIQQGKQAGIIP